MKARLLADADLRFAIVRAFKNREPGADFLPAQGIIPESMPDPGVLALATSLDRVLVSHDFETMPGHFYNFLDQSPSPGLILIPQFRTAGQAVKDLLIVWSCLEADEFRNRIVYLPL